jgi:thermolabile hemolysin
MLDLFATNTGRDASWLYFYPAVSKMALVQRAVLLMVGFLLFGSAVNPARAAFSSLYVFGDGISATTNNPSPGPQYYGKRYSNGRVWIEVLAQRQGITYESNKNWSYFYNSSTTMLAHVISSQPTNASTSLFVIWVNCADLWYLATYSDPVMSQWTNSINQSQTNHYKAATNLYAKGARYLIMPNAVDISSIPEFNQSSNTNFFRLRSLDYNIAFSNTLNRIRAACPDLTLYSPDFYALLTNMIAHPANYGLTNLLINGGSIDALDAKNYGNPKYPSAATNGYGTNYIFWNPDNPTAMVHAWMANVAQQLLSPAKFDQIACLGGSNQFNLANVPVGQSGQILGCTNLAMPSWKTNGTFVATNVAQSVCVTNSGPHWFYRLKYLYSWTWP